MNVSALLGDASLSISPIAQLFDDTLLLLSLLVFYYFNVLKNNVNLVFDWLFYDLVY